MSHGDRVEAIPPALEAIAHSGNSPYAAVRTRDGLLRGIQFHPEVAHTPCGMRVLSNFVLRVCGETGDWTPAAFVETKLAEIRARVGGEGRVLMGLSGGVDSSVAAALIHRAIGDRLKCVFVDTGLLRAGERERMETVFAGRLGIALSVADASDSVPRPAGRRARPRTKAPHHRPHVYRSVREGGAGDRRRKISRPGNALSGRDRIGLVQGTLGRDQVAS